MPLPLQFQSPQLHEPGGDLEPSTPRPLGGRMRGGSAESGAGAFEAAGNEEPMTSR